MVLAGRQIEGRLALGLGTAETAFALDGPNSFMSAEAAIAKAQTAMKMVKDKSAAGIYDHARSVAKARFAKAYAETAEILAGMSM